MAGADGDGLDAEPATAGFAGAVFATGFAIVNGFVCTFAADFGAGTPSREACFAFTYDSRAGSIWMIFASSRRSASRYADCTRASRSAIARTCWYSFSRAAEDAARRPCGRRRTPRVRMKMRWIMALPYRKENPTARARWHPAADKLSRYNSYAFCGAAGFPCISLRLCTGFFEFRHTL